MEDTEGEREEGEGEEQEQEDNTDEGEEDWSLWYCHGHGGGGYGGYGGYGCCGCCSLVGVESRTRFRRCLDDAAAVAGVAAEALLLPVFGRLTTPVLLCPVPPFLFQHPPQVTGCSQAAWSSSHSQAPTASSR